MSITAQQKTSVIKTHQQSANDTGSAEVQVALLSTRIENLTQHMKSNKQDVHSRLGLLKMVSKRRRLLNYLKNTSKERYTKLIQVLGLRR